MNIADLLRKQEEIRHQNVLTYIDGISNIIPSIVSEDIDKIISASVTVQGQNGQNNQTSQPITIGDRIVEVLRTVNKPVSGRDIYNYLKDIKTVSVSSTLSMLKRKKKIKYSNRMYSL